MGGGAVVVGDAGRINEYKGRTTLAVVMIAIVAASGGLLFGFDNGITGGVISMRDFEDKFFPGVAARRESGGRDAFCRYDDHVLQLFTSSLFLAGALAALIGSFTSKKYGRKFTMTAGGLCFLVGTVLVAAAVHVTMLIIGRIVLGFGVGFATQVTPLYLSEMAPYNLRGALSIMFQLAVTIGILAAQLINYGTHTIAANGWRISLAMGAVPALILFIGSLVLPDTPNSLVERGHLEQGRAVLERIRGVQDVDAEFDDIREAARMSQLHKHPFRTFVSRRYRPQLVITVLIPIFQQFTGINAIVFYAPQLFEVLNQGTSASLQATVIIGAVNVVSTIVSIIAVDRAGRKVLFLQGGVQMFVMEIVAAVLVYYTFQPAYASNTAFPRALIAVICIYVAGFAWSWGPLGWLVPSEIQPLEIRAAGTAVNTCVNFLMTFIIGQCFLSMLCSMKFGIFLFFAGWVLAMTMFVLFFVPETKGVPIEELHEVSIGRHWFWRRIVAGTHDAASIEKTPMPKEAGSTAV